MNIKAWILAVGLAASGFAANAADQVIGGDVAVRGDRIDNDVVAIAGTLEVAGEIEGDVFALGGEISVTGDVRGAVEVVGGDVLLAGTVQGEIDAVGGDLEVSASAGEDVELTGGQVIYIGQTPGDVEMRGGYVVFGRGAAAGGNVDIRGGEIEINGRIDGDLDVRGAEVSFGPNAVITGLVQVAAENEPRVAQGAVLAGGLNYEYSEIRWLGLHWTEFNLDYMDFMLPMRIFGGAFVGLALLLGLIAILLAPRGTSRIASTYRRRPALSMLIGLIVFAMSPIIFTLLIFLLAVTLIGIALIPFLLLALMPFFLLMIAFGGVAIGDLLFNRSGGQLGLGMRILSFLVVMIALIALGALPGIGLLAGFILLFSGLGAWAMTLGRTDPDRIDAGPSAGESAAGPAPASG
jgi:hypothetical protein